MRGEFVPFEVSDDLRKQIRDEVRKDGERRLAPELPRSELRDIYRGLRRQPLLIDQQIAVDQDFVPLGSVNQAPIPAPQPQARQQGTAKQPVSPTLLGGNPYEAMKNFELSQYLSRINPFGQ